MGKTLLMDILLEAGYPEKEIFHHASDLYIFVTPLTTSVLEKWCDMNGWNRKLVKDKSILFDIFRDQVTGRLMYDVAFQYTPFWKEREENK